jgi:hypothetical protein
MCLIIPNKAQSNFIKNLLYILDPLKICLTTLVYFQHKFIQYARQFSTVYPCEKWGFENKQGIEKLHLQFLKKILNMRNNTPNYMVYGEMGRFSMDIVTECSSVDWDPPSCEV